MGGDKCVVEKEDVIIDKSNAARSISVSGFPKETTASDLVIHFQKRKHGGGDIECIHITDKGVAVIVFDEPAVASSVLKKKQKLSDIPLTVKPLHDMTETVNEREIFQLVTAWVDDEVLKTLSRKDLTSLLNKVQNETTIKWHEASDGFLLTGTFKQVIDSRVLLGQYLKSGGSEGEENPVEKTESAGLKPQQYETTQKFFPLFVKAHGEDLQKIEKDFKVKVSRQIDEGKVTVAPCEHCTEGEFNDACEVFITLYQNVHQRMKMEQFLPQDQDSPVHTRQRIRDMGKTHPVLVEVSEDRKHWQVYGEKVYVEKVLNDLEKENLISRKMSVTHGPETWNREVVEENDPGFDDKNHLEHMLGQVKLSVLKGDITDQHVDVIVNAANTSLSHGAGVAAAIVKKGGKSIQKESDDFIRRRGLLSDGEVAMTAPGKLSCKKIIHAVGPEWRIGEEKSKRFLKNACHESLVTASNNGFKSIAFPAISSGIFGMPKDVCANVMFEAVNEYVSRRDLAKQTLTDIRFVNIDDLTVKVFKKEFIDFFRLEREPSFANNTRASNTRRSKRGGKRGGRPDHSVKDKHDNVDDPLRTKPDSPSKSFSAAVKGNRLEGADRQDGASASLKDSASGGASRETECPICLDTLTNPRTLKCKHEFCTKCVETALKHNNRCPVCKEVQGIIQGNQPKGEMSIQKTNDRLPGYYGNINTLDEIMDLTVFG